MNVVRIVCLSVMAAGVAAPQSATNNQSTLASEETGSVGHAVVPPVGSNATLQGQIQQALRNASDLDASRVSVNVTDAAIEISGTVPSGKDKQAVERLARSFDGNRKFTNDLTITGQAPAQENPPNAKAAGAGPKTTR